MSQLVEFRAQLQEADEGTFTARLVPFGEPAPAAGGGTVEFRRGSLRSHGTVPLTVDHGESVLDRVGVMDSYTETESGAYGSFSVSDTEAGRTVLTLLRDGAISDVSVGVRVDHDDDGVMFGELDHVSLVDRGRFATDSIENKSRVLSVHNMEGAEMPEETTVTTEVVTYDDSEIMSELAQMSDKLDSYAPVQKFTGSPIELFTNMVRKAAGLEVEEFALAPVIGDLGTADASGIVPEAYWGAGLQMKIDRRRPLFVTAGAAPFPAAGNNLEVPRETQETLVAKRTAEKAAANSRAFQAVTNSFPIQWFDGAVDVSYEIISQSDPSILQVVMASLLNQYATATEADATDLLGGAATATGAALDTATYGALVGDIITTSDLIEDATGLPGDILGVTSAQWIAILSLMDGGDRRQFPMINAQNADGTSSLTTRGIDIGGVFVYRAPAATIALQYNSESFKNGEKSPMQVAAENVELMGRDLGILGATVNVFWDAGIYGYKV